MESGELIAVLIVVIILLVGTIFLCFRCWKAVGEVVDDHMKPKRETRAQMIRGAVRRSFSPRKRRNWSFRRECTSVRYPVDPPLKYKQQGRSKTKYKCTVYGHRSCHIRLFRRTAAGLQRGAGHIRNSFRRARGLPPGVPAPEEPGPPTRPYGSRGGARRYPGRPGHHPGGPGHPGGPNQPPPPGFRGTPGHPQSPGPSQPVPSVSAETPEGPGHSDIHPACLPKNKRPTGTRSQSDAPPTYQEALSHETAANRTAMVTAHTGNVEVHKSPPGTSAPRPRIPSAPSDVTPPPVPPAPYPEQLAVPTRYEHSQDPSRSPHGMPPSPHDVSYGMPHSPRDLRTSPRGVPYPNERYSAQHQGHSPYHPQSPYEQSGTPSQYDHSNRQSEFRERKHQEPTYYPGYNASHPSQPTPTEQTSAHARDRDRSAESHGDPRGYHRSRSQPESPPYNPDFSRSRSQDSRDYPHLMTSHSAADNEYSQPPVPERNYSLDDDDDGGFGVRTPRDRRVQSSSSHSNVPRDYVDYRSHDQYPMRSPGGEDVDYAGYSQIPPRSVRHQTYSPTSRSYQNEAFIGDTRMPGDGAYRDQQHNDTGQSPYYPQRGPLPPLPHQDRSSRGQHSDSRAHAQYNLQQGVVFPSSDRRYMDSDTYI